MKITKRRFSAWGAGAVLATAMGATSVGLVYGDESAPVEPQAAVPNSAPGPGPRSLDAQTVSPRGQLGVLTYRNTKGERCFATGRPSPSGGRVGSPVARSFREAPLAEAGRCGPESAISPVAFTVENTPEEITVSGLADENVKSVRLIAAGEQRVTAPAADDAFIASIAGPGDNLEQALLIITFDDGTKQTMKVPILNLKESTAKARAEAKRLYPHSAGVQEFESRGG